MINRTIRFKLVCYVLLSVVFLLVLNAGVLADVRLPQIFGSKMVLQRDIELPIWGWADPGEKVTVEIGNNKAQATANGKGQWMVKLSRMKAGGPVDVVVKGKNTIRLTDVLIGEVWVATGQSNMEMGVTEVVNSQQEVAEANYPQIRLFMVRWSTSAWPVSDFIEPVDFYEKWRICNPENITKGEYGGFSATAYFFGRELHKQLGVPIGLIDSSWGGTYIEPWTPPEGFAAIKADEITRQIEYANKIYQKTVQDTLVQLESWLQNARKTVAAGGFALSPAPPWPEHLLNNNRRPTALYNSMIHPLVPFAIRGAIWYQGESNFRDGMMYHEKMKALIGGWRTAWGQGDFPFYFVQLAPYKYRNSKPSSLPEMWEAQVKSLSIPNTGMAVITDLVHDITDIHPINKQGVGKRLALWALAKTYGRENLVYSGPLFKSMKVEGDSIRVSFNHIGGGLTTRDGNVPDFFEIAGSDKKFVKAKAKIDRDTVVVSSGEVSEPVFVRFGWHEDAVPNLINKEGLPASPFGTSNTSDISIK